MEKRDQDELASEKCGKRGRREAASLVLIHTTSSAKHGGGSDMVWRCIVSKINGSLVFIYDMTFDKSKIAYCSVISKSIIWHEIQLSSYFTC